MPLERQEEASYIFDELGNPNEVTPIAMDPNAEYPGASEQEEIGPASAFERAHNINAVKADVRKLIGRRLEASKISTGMKDAEAFIIDRVMQDAEMIAAAVNGKRMDIAAADQKLAKSINAAVAEAEKSLARKLAASLRQHGPSGKKS